MKIGLDTVICSFYNYCCCFFCSLTAITSLQVAVRLVNVTDLDQVLFSVMSRASVSARTTLLARSVTCVSGDSLVFLMPPVKVRDRLV